MGAADRGGTGLREPQISDLSGARRARPWHRRHPRSAPPGPRGAGRAGRSGPCPAARARRPPTSRMCPGRLSSPEMLPRRPRSGSRTWSRCTHPVAALALEQPPDQSLVGEGPIDLGRVEQRDAGVDRFEERGFGFRSIPATRIGPGHPHASEPQRRDCQTLPTQPALFHGDLHVGHVLVGQSKIRGSLSAEGYPSGQREQTVNLPAYAFVGSNPTPSTTSEEGRRRPRRTRVGWRCGCSSMVEPQPSKLMAWVRFPSPAPVRGPGE